MFFYDLHFNWDLKQNEFILVWKKYLIIHSKDFVHCLVYDGCIEYCHVDPIAFGEESKRADLF